MADPSGDGGRGWRQRPRGVWTGAVLILLGIFFLLDNLNLLPPVTWQVIWPVILIGLGVWLILRRRT
jgi:phage shock protein C